MKQGKVYRTVVKTVYISKIPLPRNEDKINELLHLGTCVISNIEREKRTVLIGKDAVKAIERGDGGPMDFGMWDNGSDYVAFNKHMRMTIDKLVKAGKRDEALKFLGTCEPDLAECSDGSLDDMLTDIIYDLEDGRM